MHRSSRTLSHNSRSRPRHGQGYANGSDIEVNEEMLSGGKEIADEMHRLDTLTRTIADCIEDISSGAVQISKAVLEVNSISLKNKTSISALASEVEKFTLE